MNDLLQPQPPPDYIVYFDGGSTNNDPTKGKFGTLYGSYRVDDNAGPGHIHRRVFREHGSANAGEIITLCAALNEVRFQCTLHKQHAPKVIVLACGDSQVTLKWVERPDQTKLPRVGRVTPLFHASVLTLQLWVKQFGEVRTQWIPRKHIFKMFGH